MSEATFTPPTDRVRLRRFRSSDIEVLFQLESNPDIVRFTRMRVPKTRSEILNRHRDLLAKEAEREPFGIWAAELRSTGEVFAWLMLLKFGEEKNDGHPPEIGFMTLPEFQRRGLTAEAVSLLIQHATGNLNVSEILALTDADNLASRRLLEKLGFVEKRKILSSDAVLRRDIPTVEYRFTADVTSRPDQD